MDEKGEIIREYAYYSASCFNPFRGGYDEYIQKDIVFIPDKEAPPIPVKISKSLNERLNESEQGLKAQAEEIKRQALGDKKGMEYFPLLTSWLGVSTSNGTSTYDGQSL